MAATMAERITIVETKLDVVIEQQKATNAKLDAAIPSFVTHQQLVEKLSALEGMVGNSRQSRLKDLIIQALIIGPISALIGYFFANVVR